MAPPPPPARSPREKAEKANVRYRSFLEKLKNKGSFKKNTFVADGLRSEIEHIFNFLGPGGRLNACEAQSGGRSRRKSVRGA